MKLAESIETLGRIVRWGGTSSSPVLPGPNALGLDRYRRHYEDRVRGEMSDAFPITVDVVTARIGATAWSQLLTRFGREHSFSQGWIGSVRGMIEILKGPHGAAVGVPAWAWELADLELAESMVSLAEHPHEARTLRAYEYRVLGLRLAPNPREVEPARTSNVVAIWRDAEDTVRTKELAKVLISAL